MSKVMETITFPGGSEPYQVRDGRIPENPGNYQYLVTDGNGQWGTADRLAYSEENTVEVFDSFLSFEFSDDGGWTAFVDGDTDYFTDGETFALKYNNQVIADKIIVANSEIETRITNDMGDLLDLTIEKSAEGKYLVLVSDGTDTEPSLYEKLALYHVANTIHPIDPAKWLPEGYPYEETTTVFLMNEQAVTLGYDEAGDRVYGSKRVSDPSAVSEGMTVHMTISGDFSYDGDIVLQDEGTFIPIVFEGMDNSMNVSLGNNGFISFYISAVYYDVSIVVSMTSVQQIIQPIVPKFLPVQPMLYVDDCGDIYKITNGAKTSASTSDLIEWAKTFTVVCAADTELTNGLITTVCQINYYRLTTTDDCGDISYGLQLCTGTDEIFRTISITSTQYNEIQSAWMTMFKAV